MVSIRNYYDAPGGAVVNDAPDPCFPSEIYVMIPGAMTATVGYQTVLGGVYDISPPQCVQ